MPPPLPNSPQQQNIAGQLNVQHTAQQQAQVMQNFVNQVQRATPALAAMGNAARGFALGAGAAVGLPAAAGIAAAKGGFSALSYVAKNIGSQNGSFLERRLDWAVYGAGMGGASALGAGVRAGLQNNDISYNTKTGLTVGQSVLDATTFAALSKLHGALGMNFAGVASLTGGAQATADLTTQITRYGGKVTPEFREWYMRVKTQEESRALKEQAQVETLRNNMLGKNLDKMIPNVDDDKVLGVLTLMNGAMQEIKSTVKSWFAGKAATGGQ